MKMVQYEGSLPWYQVRKVYIYELHWTLLILSECFTEYPKNLKKEKNTSTLIYCISDERYNLEDLLKSDMD